jgi:hydroxymethylpyrimidine pyrophosphatase-like HAD family hydrolase
MRLWDDDRRIMILAIDFDGTLVEHDYPRIGKPVPHALHWLKEFQKQGAKLILWTMRSGETLKGAVNYLKIAGVPLFGINCNPEQVSWTDSNKAYAHIYIDDAAFGCPLIPGIAGDRAMVDWDIVGPMVLEALKVGKL